MNSFQHNAATDIEPFESRIDILFGELELAIKWERPSTLFAVFASDYVRAEAEAALTDRIRGLGHQVLRLQLGQQGASADAFLQILPGEPASVVLFVGGTGKEGPQLGPTELAGLNLLRDSLAEMNLRIVFWLREAEAVELAQRSPESWALRHRVVEFLDSPMSHEIVQCSLDGARRNTPECTVSRCDLENRIALGEELLNELPDQDQTTAVYPELLLTLGILAGRNGDDEKAVRYLTSAQDLAAMLGERRLQAECLMALGRQADDRGEVALALDAYEKAFDLAPDHETLPRDLGILYLEAGRTDRAIDVFLVAIAQSPEDAAIWRRLGDAYLAQGQNDSALAAYEKSLSIDPGPACAWIGLGKALVAATRLEEASQAFQQAVTQNPDSARAWLALGETLLKLHQIDAAQDAFDRLAEIDAKQQSAQSNVPQPAGSDARAQKNGEVIGMVRSGPDELLETMDEEVHFSLGQYEKSDCLVCSVNSTQDGIVSLATPSPLESETPESNPVPSFTEPDEGAGAGDWNETGHAHLEAGRYDAAIAAYIRAIELSDGSNWSYINNLTQAYYRRGQHPENGPTDGEDQTNETPGISEPASIAAGVAIASSGAAEQLVDEPDPTGDERVAEAAQPEPEMQVESAPAEQQVRPETVASTGEVPAEAIIFAGVGVSVLLSGAQHEEINFKERALRPTSHLKWLPKAFRGQDIDPKLLAEAAHEDVRFGLRRQRRYLAEDEDIPAKAILAEPRASQDESVQEAPVPSPKGNSPLEGPPITAQGWLEQGNSLLRTGLYDEAIACYNRSLALSPRSGGTYSNMALAYCYKEQYAEAVPLYQKSIYLLRTNKEKAICWNRLGDAYRRLNDQTSAAAAYRNAAELYPGTNTLRTRARAALLSNATAQ